MSPTDAIERALARHPTPWSAVGGPMPLVLDKDGYPLPLRVPDYDLLNVVVNCVNAGPVRDQDFMRWENGFRNIVSILIGHRKTFEIVEVVEMVRSLTDQVKKLENDNAALTAQNKAISEKLAS